MKIAIITSLALSLFASTARAQTMSPPAAASQVEAPPAARAPEEPQTLARQWSAAPSPITGWFVAPTFTVSRIDGALAYGPGVQAGLILDRRVGVGLVANAVANENSYFEGEPVRSVGTYGGLLLQYIVQSNRLVHATFESTVGPGRWCVQVGEETDGCQGRTFLTVEPVANVELNLGTHVRLAAGVGYRFAVAGEGTGPNSAGLSSLVARTSLVLGRF